MENKTGKVKNKKEWYRNEKWDEDEKKRFFQKLKRCRIKSRYICDKAIFLYNTKRGKQVKDAIDLWNLAFKEKWVEGNSGIYLYMARCYSFLNEKAKALEYFEKSLTAQREDAHVIGTIWSNYAEYIITNGLKDMYGKAIDMLEEMKERRGFVFPMDVFVYYGLRAVIFNEIGKQEEAVKEAALALAAAGLKHSGFTYHPQTGVRKEGEGKWLLEKLNKISNYSEVLNLC